MSFISIRLIYFYININQRSLYLKNITFYKTNNRQTDRQTCTDRPTSRDASHLKILYSDQIKHILILIRVDCYQNFLVHNLHPQIEFVSRRKQLRKNAIFRVNIRNLQQFFIVYCVMSDTRLLLSSIYIASSSFSSLHQIASIF